MIGTSIFIRDGFAEIEFLDRATTGPLIGRLVRAAKAEGARIRTDTGGRRKRYIVPEYIAAAAGFLEVEPDDDPLPSVPPVVVSEWDPFEDHPDVTDATDDTETVTAPPKPGTKGATKAAWTAYAERIGVPVTADMTVGEIAAACAQRTG